MEAMSRATCPVFPVAHIRSRGEGFGFDARGIMYTVDMGERLKIWRATPFDVISARDLEGLREIYEGIYETTSYRWPKKRRGES